MLQILLGPDPPKGRPGRRQGNVGPAVPPIEMGGLDRGHVTAGHGPPVPLTRLREERYRACSPPTLALCARQGGARPENCGRWVPIEREARTPAGRCQGGWSDGKVDSSYRGRIGRLLLRPSYRTRTPRRVKGSYKALI